MKRSWKGQAIRSFSSPPASLIGAASFYYFLLEKLQEKKTTRGFQQRKLFYNLFLTGATFHKTNHLPYSESYIDVFNAP